MILLALAALTASSAGQAEVYRWVDENGEVHYTETLPPDHADKGHDVLNEAGIVVDEDQTLTPPPPPPEETEKEKVTELPRDSSGLPRPEPLYTDTEMQSRMDSFLMLRYDSEQEILEAMNVEIKQLDYDRRLLKTSKGSLQQAYRGQIEQAAHKQRAGQQVDPSIEANIRQLQGKLASNSKSLDSLAVREAGIRADFQKQMERYRHLIEKWAEESAEG